MEDRLLGAGLLYVWHNCYMTGDRNTTATEYLRQHAAKSNFHIAMAFDHKANELIARGHGEEHPAVMHLRDRAETFRSSPENN